MRVLYASHTGEISGAERSLLDLIEALPSGVLPVAACPRGPLREELQKLGIPTWTIPHAEPSFRVRPVATGRGVATLVADGLRLRRIARETDANLVHANTVRAGLSAVLASRLGGPPALVHVRDCLPEGWTANTVRTLLGRGARTIIANSRHTAASFDGSGQGTPVQAVPNGVEIHRFDPTVISRSAARDRIGLDRFGPLLGVVAQITPWKAQDDAVRILARVREVHPGSRLLIVGEPKFAAARYDNRAFRRSLDELVARLELDSSVLFLGERNDIPEIMRALDLLLVPSWEEPFGRSVVEAMAMETPVIATTVGGPAEIITPGKDGLLAPPRQPERWAEAASRLLANPDHRESMGRQARATVVERYSLKAHVETVIRIYERALK